MVQEPRNSQDFLDRWQPSRERQVLWMNYFKDHDAPRYDQRPTLGSMVGDLIYSLSRKRTFEKAWDPRRLPVIRGLSRTPMYLIVDVSHYGPHNPQTEVTVQRISKREHDLASKAITPAVPPFARVRFGGGK